MASMLEEYLMNEQSESGSKGSGQSPPLFRRVRTYVGENGGSEFYLCWDGFLASSAEAACCHLKPIHDLVKLTTGNRFNSLRSMRKCVRYYRRNISKCTGGYRVLASGETFARKLDAYSRVADLESQVRRLAQKHFGNFAQLRAVAGCEAAVARATLPIQQLQQAMLPMQQLQNVMAACQ